MSVTSSLYSVVGCLLEVEAQASNELAGQSNDSCIYEDIQALSGVHASFLWTIDKLCKKLMKAPGIVHAFLQTCRHNNDAIAKHLRAAFGLTLFGFDIISVPVRSGGGEERRPTGMDGETNDRQGDYKQQLSNDLCGLGSVGVASQREEGCVCGYQLVVIDVNYFPSYSSPGAAAHVWQAMLNRILG
eukprot:scaffold212251_cov18-Tisochrysis_lutea.AAC.1